MSRAAGSGLGAVPGPRSWGPLSAQRAILQLAADPLGKMTRLFADYGPIVSLVRGGGTRVFSNRATCPGTVFLRGSELLRQVECDGVTFHRTPLSGKLYPKDAKSTRRQALTEWATGLFAVNGDEHRRHRRILSEPFRARQISGYLEEIFEDTDSHLANWGEGQRIDLHQEMMDLTLAIALRSFFGCDLSGNKRIANAQARSLRMVLSPWVLLAPFDLPGLPYRRFLSAVGEFNREMRGLIDEKRRKGCSGSDVLSRLIQAASEDATGLSAAEIVGHASVVFAAGHETSSNALTFALFLISQHPGVHEALYSELASNIGDGRPSAEELERMPVLDSVVRETLRILPPAPWNARVAVSAVDIGGFWLPADTEVIGSIFHTHRIPEIYESPRKFLPSRWQRIRPNQFEFNPFGGGARLCLGAAFATMEMKAVLAAIVRRFRLAAVPMANVEPVVNITMSLRRGLPMTVRKQDLRFDASVVPVRGGIHKLVDLPRMEKG